MDRERSIRGSLKSGVFMREDLALGESIMKPRSSILIDNADKEPKCW